MLPRCTPPPTDVEIEAVNLIRHDFHGEWSYMISLKLRALER